MKLSVIIPCLNAADTISVQLKALAGQHWSEPWEVIVSDNGSTDNTLEIVKQYAKQSSLLHVVNASHHKGRGVARNVGARYAAGEALAFCDADDEVAPGWVAAIGEALRKHDFVASRFEGKKLNSPEILKIRGCAQENGLQEYDYPPYLPHSGGCGLGVKSALHKKIGGFDETMLVLEDTDYCWRIQLAGTKLNFVPDAMVHIRFRDTVTDTCRQARLWGEYNVLMYKRYRSLGMPKLSVKRGLKAWIQLLRSYQIIHNQEKRTKWMWELNWRMGRLQGSIKHRVFAL